VGLAALPDSFDVLLIDDHSNEPDIAGVAEGFGVKVCQPHTVLCDAV
jgi:hypothetical protein